MRILLVLGVVVLLALSPLNASRGAHAEPGPRTLAAQADDADREAIAAAAIDYAMGYYEGDGARMERALHPQLAKRRVRDWNGRARLDPMSALELVQLARGGHGKDVPVEQRRHEVQVLDVDGDTASVKLTMHAWIDYMHLAKVDGRWQIVNVLWRLTV